MPIRKVRAEEEVANEDEMAHEEEEMPYNKKHGKKGRKPVNNILGLFMLAGVVGDVVAIFYLTNDLDFTNEYMPASRRRDQYMNIVYAAFHYIRVISFVFMFLINDSYARRQYFDIWWITSPIFLLCGMGEIVFNTDIWRPCSQCDQDRMDWLWWYVPIATGYIFIYLRLSYWWYCSLARKYVKKEEHHGEQMEEDEAAFDEAPENAEENMNEFNAQFLTIKGKKIIRSKKY